METEPLKTNEKKLGDLLGFDLIACEKKINYVLSLAYEVRNEFSNAGFENGARLTSDIMDLAVEILADFDDTVTRFTRITRPRSVFGSKRSRK
jgi:hypothetical protein